MARGPTLQTLQCDKDGSLLFFVGNSYDGSSITFGIVCTLSTNVDVKNLKKQILLKTIFRVFVDNLPKSCRVFDSREVRRKTSKHQIVFVLLIKAPYDYRLRVTCEKSTLISISYAGQPHSTDSRRWYG